MNDLRNLLIDCRIELRKVSRDFHKGELCGRVDAAVQTLAQAPVDLDARPAPAVAAAGARKIKETSNQVALAWQMAARDLKFTHPPLYDAMSKKVMSRLETKTLVDQTDELRQLEDTVADLGRQQAEAEKRRAATEAERNTLLGALASAVPELTDGGDEIGVALARIDWLKAQVPRTPMKAAARAQLEEESQVPTAEVLTAVAAGARKFTSGQREWSIGEAMVLSGFQFTPMELIEQGDPSIAAIIVKSRAG